MNARLRNQIKSPLSQVGHYLYVALVVSIINVTFTDLKSSSLVNFFTPIGLACLVAFFWSEVKNERRVSRYTNEANELIERHLVLKNPYFINIQTLAQLSQKIVRTSGSVVRKRENIQAALNKELQKNREGYLWWENLRGVELEGEVHHIFSNLGFTTHLTPSSGDGGIDVIVDLTTTEHLLIQCKGWAVKVAVGPVRELAGVTNHITRDSGEHYLGVIATVNGLTAPAKRFADTNNVFHLGCRDFANLARLRSKLEALNYLEELVPTAQRAFFDPVRIRLTKEQRLQVGNTRVKQLGGLR